MNFLFFSCDALQPCLWGTPSRWHHLKALLGGACTEAPYIYMRRSIQKGGEFRGKIPSLRKVVKFSPAEIEGCRQCSAGGVVMQVGSALHRGGPNLRIVWVPVHLLSCFHVPSLARERSGTFATFDVLRLTSNVFFSAHPGSVTFNKFVFHTVCLTDDSLHLFIYIFGQVFGTACSSRCNAAFTGNLICTF